MGNSSPHLCTLYLCNVQEEELRRRIVRSSDPRDGVEHVGDDPDRLRVRQRLRHRNLGFGLEPDSPSLEGFLPSTQLGHRVLQAIQVSLESINLTSSNNEPVQTPCTAHILPLPEN